METKKKNINYTADEKKILADLVLKYQSVVENKRTDATTNTQKLNGWIRLEQEFNSLSTYCHRSHQSLKICWENIKRQTKKESANKKKELFKTGGGLPPPAPSDKTVKIVEAVLGPAIEGLTNNYDSDAVGVINSNIIEINSEMEDNTPSEFNLQIPESTEEWKVLSAIIEPLVDAKSKENVNPISKMKDIDHLTDSVPSTSLKKDDEWVNWTPKNLKRPLAEPLRDCIRRRRPNDSTSDTLMKKKIELVEILKKNAQEEAIIRNLILKEQLKQEQIKTKKLLDESENK